MVTYGDRSFAAAAPKLWNNLPLFLKNSTNIITFKKELKTKNLFPRWFTWYFLCDFKKGLVTSVWLQSGICHLGVTSTRDLSRVMSLAICPRGLVPVSCPRDLSLAICQQGTCHLGVMSPSHVPRDYVTSVWLATCLRDLSLGIMSRDLSLDCNPNKGFVPSVWSQ